MAEEALEDLITRLALIEHDEGGWFRETYRSDDVVATPDRAGGSRAVLTCIYYLLSIDAPCGVLHRNRSDIHHFYQGGGVLRYVTLDEAGRLNEHLLGPGYDMQLTVPGGVWKASELVEGPWGLVGEAVSPGFDYRDREIAVPDEISRAAPQQAEQLARFLRG